MRYSLLIFPLIFVSCSYKGGVVSKTPSWITNPTIGVSKNKRVGIGCASIHYKGEEAQKKLALKRAIEQVSMQKSSKVESVSLSKKSSSATGYRTSRDTSSLHTVSGVYVKTIIKNRYKYPDGKYCIRVIEE